MQATKSIFEKAYITSKQCEAAIDKAFGDDAISYVAKQGDDRKWRVLEIPAVEAEVATAEPLRSVGGFTHCPCCQISLDNGYSYHGDEVNGEPLFHERYEFMCLGCGDEFGPAIASTDLGAIQADRQANASMGVQGAKPRLSSCEKPTKRVWHIADSMPMASRKDVMAECVRQGIAYGTARTQYQAWFKASQDSKRGDIRQPHAKGE